MSIREILFLFLFAFASTAELRAEIDVRAEVDVQLAGNGRTDYAILIRDGASQAERYAADELATYLSRISAAEFPVVVAPATGSAGGDAHPRIGGEVDEAVSRDAAGWWTEVGAEQAIVLSVAPGAGVHRLAGDAYAITVRGSRIHLTGGNPRAVLYAVYDFLGRLGCRWIAPDLELYQGLHEFVPNSRNLTYRAGSDVIESPTFSIRKLDTGGARSHTIETLREQIEWMAKLRFNTLMVSMTAGLGNSIDWDDWREDIVPELEKRDMLLQVGGHGYQNFLNAEMEDGALFERHPDWFGRDENCEPRKQVAYVFNTGNDDAVNFLIEQVVQYVKDRPEIDIFGFWPPDMAHWADCPAFEALGAPHDRQAQLVTRLHGALGEEAPNVRLEMIAYEHALVPPKPMIPADVLVDFCPLSQNFDVPIYDPSSVYNKVYAEAVTAWREAFTGDIGLYSYYRKYAWRSLPNLLPHYMKQDLEWYASLPLEAVSSYAEPGDWFTYEVNHYVFGNLAWDTSVDVDSLITDYSDLRFGRSAGVARKVVASLERAFRPAGSIPYSDADSAAVISAAQRELAEQSEAVREARTSTADETEAESLHRLSLMLDFALRDLEIQHAKAQGASDDVVHDYVRELVAFRTVNRDYGVFVVYGRGDEARFIKHYTRDWSEVAPGGGI